jgi:2-aminobenzoylacetyl-CoA thioesterase
MNSYEVGNFPFKLAEGLWVVGNYYFNLYVVRGEQASALVEVGVSAVADEVIRQLEQIGVIPSFLVVTHPHADHLTGLTRLKEKYRQALVVTGEGAEEFLSHPKASQSIVEEDAYMTKLLQSRGIIPGCPPVDHAPVLETPLVALDGDGMELGGLTLEFLAAEGHSPGNIVVHVPEIKALMSSDSLGFRFPGRGFFPLFLTGYQPFIKTVNRMKLLKPAIVGPAHQGPLTGHQAETVFQEALEAAERVRNRVLEDNRPVEELVQEVFSEYYKDELLLYTPENIISCVRLLVKRSLESSSGLQQVS